MELRRLVTVAATIFVNVICLTGCATQRVYLPTAQCWNTVEGVCKLLRAHSSYQELDARAFAKGLKGYPDFRKRYEVWQEGADDARRMELGEPEPAIKRDYGLLLRRRVLDASDLVDRLPRVKLSEGKTLDYICPAPFGRTILYARDTQSQPLTNSADLASVYLPRTRRGQATQGRLYLSALVTDGSPMSYFELAFLVLIEHGALLDREIVAHPLLFSQEDVARWCEAVAADGRGDGRSPFPVETLPPDGVRQGIECLDLRPYVEVRGDAVVVSCVTIGSVQGLTRHFLRFATGSPHCLVDWSRNQLIDGWYSDVTVLLDSYPRSAMSTPTSPPSTMAVAHWVDLSNNPIPP